MTAGAGSLIALHTTNSSPAHERGVFTQSLGYGNERLGELYL
jgi:hypothetical protein